MRTVHLIIKGKVQGVFFRVTAREKAEKYGLSGWVKNTASGDVETVVSGKSEDVKKYIDWCRQGPAKAKVSEVIIQERNEELTGKFEIVR